MIGMGLRASEMRELRALLISSHRIDIIVQLMNLSHGHVGDVSNKLMGGQVTIDATAATTRVLELQLADPQYRLKLDSDSPEDGAIYMTNMFKIIFVVSPPDNSKHYTIPIFCGPVTKVDRAGPILTVECQGKEVLAFATVWNSRTYKKKLKKTSVIRSIMSSTGESRFDFIESNTTLPLPISANRKKTFWLLARRIAGGMNLHLFYDGRGVLRLRKVPTKTAYVFRDTESLLSIPVVGYDGQGIRNAVEIIGGKPKGSKTKIHYRLVAPRSHPLSPWKLGRNGTPRYLPITIEDDTIKSMRAARERAKNVLKGALAESVEVAFDSLPIPFLEEMDLCRFSCGDSAGSFRLKKMTIPLVAGGKSNVGYLRRVKPKARTRR